MRRVLFFVRVLQRQEAQMEGEEAAGARCTVFCNGFCTPKAPEVDAILFFTSALNRLPLPPARLGPAAGPPPARLVVNGKPSTRVAGVRFVPKTKVLYESGNVLKTWFLSPALRDAINGIPLKDT